ncbi:ClpP class periplasmic serine protease [Oleiphilus messinensis]|uniref:ClpP class periplasmic serine protease n=1 Tax=Oleiphilus messinensis TaxID=141451 RepID=A0A1Y0IAE2_9GAMM|nr:protease SohB [Oleiphilus messinensis]ARU57431.1 ClpP class periplasmic serine protease [Oleiphilus messinensis]
MSKLTGGFLHVSVLNDLYTGMTKALEQKGIKKKEESFSVKELVAQLKASKKPKPTLFVIDFVGDVQATGVDALAREVSAVIDTAKPTDEVLLRLDSPGGVVHGYGQAAAELERLKQANIRLTVAVDQVAASGGYMMACIADRIVAAPLAIVGSIGVIAEMPNIHKLLQKVGIEYEQAVAGEYKRPLSVFTENTSDGREKFTETVQKTHELFRSHVQTHRSIKDFDKVANGHVFYGQEALSKNLVDEIATSESLISQYCRTHKVITLRWMEPVSWADRLGMVAQLTLSHAIDGVTNRLTRLRLG